jgi:hypothetical protein
VILCFRLASVGGNKLRWGLDGGGHYGTAHARFEPQLPELLQRFAPSLGRFLRTDTRNDGIGAAYVALHADLEIPCGGSCILFAGLRTEVFVHLERPSADEK